MYLIHEKFWAYMPSATEPERVSQVDIRTDLSKGHPVNTFQELVAKTARLSFLNRKWFLLFRGQTSDYATTRGNVSLYPSIYRDVKPKKILSKSIKEQRFFDLDVKVKRLISGYPKTTRAKKHEAGRLERHFELAWAILQHYDIVPTPYLDLSASLRVAASFATLKATSGYVYVIAVPYPQGSITHAIDEDIKIVRLQAACPPSAHRPHFQEGYLVGSCYVTPSQSRTNQNLSRRLITKFFIPDTTAFWTRGEFDPIPEKALYPTLDESFSWVHL